MLSREDIARRAVQELEGARYVNLGIGLPTLVASYLAEDAPIHFHSENGLLGVGPYPLASEVDAELINAGKETVTALPGASTFDSAISFAMIRSGRIDVALLGALEVAENGDLANWMIPGKMVKGMGGAMDLVAGARRVVILMEHRNRKGASKLRTRCTLPLTGLGVVSRVITDLAVLDLLPEGRFLLCERAPGVSVADIQTATEGHLELPAEVPEMRFDSALLAQLGTPRSGAETP